MVALSPSPCRRQRTSAGFMGAILVSLTALVGCGTGKPDVPLGAVSGRVTFDGEPLADALVAFEPANGRPSFGRTDSNGVYRLEYRGKPWGAVIGRHTVRITTSRLLNPEEEQQGAEPEIAPEIIPQQYNRASTLTATVVEGENAIHFDLTAS